MAKRPWGPGVIARALRIRCVRRYPRPVDLSPRRLAIAALDFARGRLDSSASQRFDAAPATATHAHAVAPMGTALPSALGVHGGSPLVSVGAQRMDGGCGTASLGCEGQAYGSRNWFGSPRDLLELQAGLSDDLIDWLCVDELFNTIATLLPSDACEERPELVGPTLGELDDVWAWLCRRSYGGMAGSAEDRRLEYAFKYGGAATVCFVDDGQPADRPVDLARVRGVIGFYSLPRRWVTPDNPSSDVRAGWWGQRAGEPSHYWVNPSTTGSAWEAGAAGGPRGGELDDLQALLRVGGQRFHASRVIATAHRKNLDWRQRRMFPNWRGWGPGIVEGCVAVFESRRWGMLRVFDVMNGLGYDVLTSATDKVSTAKSTPSAGAALKNFLLGLKACRDLTGEGVPVVALDAGMSLQPLTRQLSGISNLTAEQRTMLLDYVPYPRVILYKETTGGMNGGAAEGERAVYKGRVRTHNAKVRWPGLRHAAILAMAAKDGPTSGQVDFDVEAANFKTDVEASERDRSEARKRDAEARQIDAATLGMTAEAMASLDSTLERDYPGLRAALDASRAARRSRVVVPAGLPSPALAAPVANGEAGVLGEPAAPAAATSAAPTVGSPTDDSEVADAFDVFASEPVVSAGEPLVAAPPAAALPDDLVDERTAARAFGMTRVAFRRWAAAHDLPPDVGVGKGARGGARWSAARIKAAMVRSVEDRADALIRSPCDG